MQENTSKRSKPPNQRQVQLQKELPQLEALFRLKQQQEWVMYLKPLLSLQLTNKWLDPTKYPSNEEFIRAYDAMYGRAIAYQEIIDLIDSSESRIEEIKRQLEITEKSYGI